MGVIFESGRNKLKPLLVVCGLFLLSACGSPLSQPAAAIPHHAIPAALLQGSGVGDWPMFGYDPGHTGYVDPVVQPHNIQGKLLWSQKFAPVFSSAVSGQSSLFIGSTDGYLYALSQNTGAIVWRTPVHDNLTDATPALEGQVLFVAIHSTGLEALNTHNGQVYWQFEMNEKIQAPPLAVAGHVFLATRTTVWALDAASGKLLWKFHHGIAGWPTSAAPTFFGNTLYVGLGSGTQFLALNVANGKVLWSFDTGDRITSTALVAGNTVFLATWHGIIYALNRSTGRKLWSYSLNAKSNQTVIDGVGGSMALADRRLYVGDYRGTLLCLDALKGREVWRYATGTEILGTPVLSAELVYIGSSDGYFYALNRRTGRPAWRYLTGEVRSSATLANNHLYIGSLVGKMYAFA